jgi:radical SAM protein with 4Fe4S-binding SPASM domain
MNTWLEFTTFIGSRLPCPNNCRLCPQTKLGYAYNSDIRVMSLESFKAMLARVPADLEIQFSGYTEPLFNMQTPEMLAWASVAGHRLRLNTTLVGLTDDGASKLPRRIDTVTIHIPDQKEFRFPDNLWIKQHELWRTTGISASYMAMRRLPNGPIKVHLASLGIKVKLPEMCSRAGLLWTIPVDAADRLACKLDRWHANIVMPNGDVYLCCMDYGLEERLGNILTDSYDTIYAKGEQCRTSVHPVSSICRHCEYGVPY